LEISSVERLDGVKQGSHEARPQLSIKEYLKIEMENLNRSTLDDKAKGKQVGLDRNIGGTRIGLCIHFYGVAVFR